MRLQYIILLTLYVSKEFIKRLYTGGYVTYYRKRGGDCLNLRN